MSQVWTLTFHGHYLETLIPHQYICQYRPLKWSPFPTAHTWGGPSTPPCQPPPILHLQLEDLPTLCL